MLGRSLVVGLAIVFTASCGGDPEPVAPTPAEDSGTLADTTVDTMTDTTVDTTSDDTATEPDTLADSASDDVLDTFVADTFVTDTFVADTFVADTFVADTFVADTFVADTFVADTGVDTADACTTPSYTGLPRPVATGSAPTMTWTYENPTPTSNQLTEVQGLPSGAVLVGGRGGALLRYSGGAWTSLQGPNTSAIMRMWAASETDIWLISLNTTSTGLVSGTTLWRGQPGAWTRPTGAPSSPNLVAGCGPNDVWIANGNSTLGTTSFAHWNGSTFTSSSITGVVTAMTCRTPTDVWALGTGGNGYRYNGTTWTTVPLGTSESMRSVSARAADDAWAVGTNGRIIRWNGTAWSIVASTTTADLYRVFARAADDAWAVGNGTPLRWNGTAWARTPTPAGAAPVGTFSDEWIGVGGTATETIAVGRYGRLGRWTGSEWSDGTTGYRGRLYAVWGASATDLWAVGDDVLRSNGGGSWSVVATGPKNMRTVWGSGANDVWLGGLGGAVWHWNGSTFESRPIGSTSTVFGLFGTTPTSVYAAATSTSTTSPTATVLRWNGSAWVTEFSRGGGARALWAAAPNDVWAVGNGSSRIFYRRFCDAWSLASSGPTTAVATSIWGSAVNDVYAATGVGVFRFAGSTWSEIDTKNNVRAVYGTSPNDVWFANAYTTSYSPQALDVQFLFGNGGATLQWVPTPMSAMPESIFGVANDLWIVGDGGTILRGRR